MGNGLVWILSELGGNIFFVRSDITLGHNWISFKIIFSSLAVSRLFVRTLNDGVPLGTLLQVITSILTRQKNSLYWRKTECNHAIYYKICTQILSLIHFRLFSVYSFKQYKWYNLLTRIHVQNILVHTLHSIHKISYDFCFLSIHVLFSHR